MGSYIKTILILIVLVFLVTFGIKNNETMILQFYFQLSSMPIPVYAVVYGSLLVGIFIGMIVGISARVVLSRAFDCCTSSSLETPFSKTPGELVALNEFHGL